jgi:2-keto-4-pentenoate hydratase
MTGVETMVKALCAAHAGAWLSVGANGGPRNVMEAYRVQEGVLRELSQGRRPTAWKVSPVRDGSDPLASPVPAQCVHASPARLSTGERIVLGVECEIAFRFASTPPVDQAGGEDALESVGEAIVLMELCESRLSDWAETSPLWRLADFQSHGAFVLGSGTRDWRTIDYARQEAQLHINGRPVVRAAGGHATRDLPAMVAWAVRHCARRGMPLAAGDVVTTGSWTGLTAVRAGEQLRAVFPGLGDASLFLA